MDLRVAITGHVDHGKSTLIGRLMYDTGSLADGKAEEIIASSERRGLAVEWSFAVDAAQEERDQAITIETTRVWMHYGGRRIVIIDTPGHREFIRNMMSGAADADAGILVIDALEGIADQTYRHAYLLRLLDVPEIIVAVNKIDAVDRSGRAFRADQPRHPLGARDRRQTAARDRAALGPRRRQRRQSLRTHRVVYRSDADRRAGVAAPGRAAGRPPAALRSRRRLPFQRRRAHLGRQRRGRNDCARRSRAHRAERRDDARARHQALARGSLARARGPSRGPHLRRSGVHRSRRHRHPRRPSAARRDHVVRRRVLLALGSAAARRRDALDQDRPRRSCGDDHRHRRDDRSRHSRQSRSPTNHPSIRRSPCACARRAPLRRKPGARCVLLRTGEVVGGGKLSTVEPVTSQRSDNLVPQGHLISRETRAHRNGYRGLVAWLTGLPGSGKSTIAMAVERELFARGYFVYVLDGDNVRDRAQSRSRFHARRASGKHPARRRGRGAVRRRRRDRHRRHDLAARGRSCRRARGRARRVSRDLRARERRHVRERAT